MALKVGDMAPGFTLKSSEKQDVSLSDYLGKNVVILFFPMAFTSVCTAELCEIRDKKELYDGLKADVLAISVDSPFTLAKFKEDQGYNFPLLSDFNKEVSQKYGAYYEEFVLGLKGVSKRSAFVVDKDGVIKYAEVLDKASDLPNFDLINSILETM
ncbi:MAG: redoxin domain-containing protein [Saprospiraceae bacterium]|nr:redoxin domain-containing protein [Saprospiraceae bacterium]MCB9310362.1 redoxin domain-containing protein [Lewinellaceae bacterium]